MKYCSHCGKQIADDVAFCPYCGTNVVGDTYAPVQPVQSSSGNETLRRKTGNHISINIIQENVRAFRVIS